MGTVRRRRVLYMPGFDPKGASRYYHLYKEAGGEAVGPRARAGEFLTRWEVAPGTTYDVLRWDDIMRAHWPRGPYALLGTMFRTTGRHLLNGMLWKTLKVSWPAMICATYPSLMLLAVSPLAIVPPLFRRAVEWLNNRYSVTWMMSIYGFNRVLARRLPELEERMQHFAGLLIDAMQSDVDEVLLVGHSTGAQMAASILGKALKRDPQLPQRGPQLSLLTLGGSIPMLGWQKEAEWFRDELDLIASTQGIDWIDFTAAQDGACFALQNPYDLIGLPHDEAFPKILSTKMFDMFTPAAMKKLHRDFGAIHFHYLKANERAADYDYFALTSGPAILGSRFAHRETVTDFDRFKLRIFRRA
jgi:hypothetical protein